MATASTADENYDDIDDDGGLSGFWILVIFLIVLAAFAGIVYIAYQKGIQQRASNESALPTIAADPTPIREEVPLANVDSSRREVIDEMNDTTPSRVVADVDPQADPLEDFTSEPARSVTVPTTDDVRIAANASLPTTQPRTTPTQTPSSTTTAPQREAVTPTPKPRQPDPKPAASTTKPVTPAVGSGTHTVQVGAFGSRDEALGHYGSMMTKMGPLVGNYAPEVQNAVVNGKEYNRLWIGQFASYDAASAYCDQLKAKGQDCLVRKR
ncbi:SPOR domain-containing protein [Parvularcula sp. LCG005]|uniref:SPOR domain-containing protein n=1 Tax=Parvularcula sp. LCG005 TaxID=3078805 RepID=UPI002942B036|nr:SPOR domain-containing protein [Parvularcula sp. LCG005]WOI52433.1 SPOR domain-containing protein [Parvularcula sp. LCG005]